MALSMVSRLHMHAVNANFFASRLTEMLIEGPNHRILPRGGNLVHLVLLV
jgi:hypothetical protein